ncbi:MAG: Diaminopimelate decarboxylase [candidate division CPR2 bacterium GW2011_GWC1_39_9]|uniref:Diaminopimelate decarboxylase n=1 Tax=candidate division CPR2 bacterium GW2011_GWC2_39_10 TaxID=1618345 RepID=A0A0G0LTD7_UNCC2|nr:MAG: Diaminopimelate decarboxylase [candidate division CPR2 bacterium GW2011_GWC2_39_10]KKR35189.1 MAG: Diaminopimelate decarboxylase [candidate division CPR2 bacterium GW2011_GWC1_39_9]
MPMSKDFEDRLFPILQNMVEQPGFETPFHIYDEVGIRKTCQQLKRNFANVHGFQEFFAVKANPNPAILKIMMDEGFGFDCSSVPELYLATQVGAKGKQIMFTSNNTSISELLVAQKYNCIINYDDISMIKKGGLRDLFCCRYNPGPRRDGNEIIGKPEESKYGIPHKDIVLAYQLAHFEGAKRFGLHTMICSNMRSRGYLEETVEMLLGLIEEISGATGGILFEFINMGGGLGIPYRPGESYLMIPQMAKKIEALLANFKSRNGYTPKLFMESGRYMTGPHGVLVTTVINRMSKYRQYIGIDASMSALMRPAIYGAYHHITVPGKCILTDIEKEKVDVVGSLCENNDKFAIQRELPVTEIGDLLVIHDTGAHGYAMGFNYNGRLRPKELLLREDGSVELIRRNERIDDYLATLNFTRQIFTPKKMEAIT